MGIGTFQLGIVAARCEALVSVEKHRAYTKPKVKTIVHSFGYTCKQKHEYKKDLANLGQHYSSLNYLSVSNMGIGKLVGTIIFLGLAGLGKGE